MIIKFCDLRAFALDGIDLNLKDQGNICSPWFIMWCYSCIAMPSCVHMVHDIVYNATSAAMDFNEALALYGEAGQMDKFKENSSAQTLYSNVISICENCLLHNKIKEEEIRRCS